MFTGALCNIISSDRFERAKHQREFVPSIVETTDKDTGSTHMKPVRTFAVIPNLPAPLERLRILANNLRWAWNHQTIELFRRLDSNLWESCGHNPVAMLGK